MPGKPKLAGLSMQDVQTLPVTLTSRFRNGGADARWPHPTAGAWVQAVIRRVQAWLRSYRGIDLLAEGPTRQVELRSYLTPLFALLNISVKPPLSAHLTPIAVALAEGGIPLGS
jgi:hypothetical protein